MVTYKKARPGHVWALTESGLELSRIRVKFEKDYPQRTMYEKQVPFSWVERGYVKEARCEQDIDKSN